MCWVRTINLPVSETTESGVGEDWVVSNIVGLGYNTQDCAYLTDLAITSPHNGLSDKELKSIVQATPYFLKPLLCIYFSREQDFHPHLFNISTIAHASNNWDS